jgi:hypothetical protein
MIKNTEYLKSKPVLSIQIRLFKEFLIRIRLFKNSIQFQIVTRIRIRNLELRIRIRQKVPDPCVSGSTTLIKTMISMN